MTPVIGINWTSFELCIEIKVFYNSPFKSKYHYMNMAFICIKSLLKQNYDPKLKNLIYDVDESLFNKDNYSYEKFEHLCVCFD